MPTQPKQFAVFILNANGSGTVKQFETWQAAMEAYSSEDSTGKAVYLYTTPMRSSGAGNAPILAPAATPVTFTAAQNTGQYEWPPTPPLPRPLARDPNTHTFGTDDFDRWLTYCTANPTHRECTIPGKEKFGTLHSTICSLVDLTSVADDTGQPFPASIPQQIMHNGLGGTYEAGQVPGAEYFDSPCHYPNGFQRYGETTFIAPEIVIFTLKSNATAGPAFQGLALTEERRELRMWNGSGGSEVVRTEHGFSVPGGFGRVPLVPAEDGDSITKLDGSIIGTINVVYPLMPSSDNHIEEVGTEMEDVMVNITQRGTTVKSGTRSADKFENKWPEMNPDSYVSNIGYDPDVGTGTGSWSITHNGLGGAGGVKFEWIPGTPADGRPPAGWAGYVRRDASADFDKVDPPVPTPEGQTWLGEWVYAYYPDGTILDEDDDNYYKSNGSGGYYAEAKDDNPGGCDAAGELSRGPTQDYMYETSCGSHQLGYYNVVLYADGNCLTYEANDYDITSTGDFTTCEGIIYSVDAEGVVTTREEEGCNTSGTSLGTDPNDSCNDIFADGMCGTYTSSNGSCDDNGGGDDEPDCDPSGTDLGQDPSDGCQNIFADGNCGTYTSDNGTCPQCEDSALHTDGQEGWSYNGCEWSYDPDWDSGGGDGGDGGGGECDSAGNMISGGQTDDLYITTPCGETVGGERTYDVYTDGNCGTTEQTTNEAWYSNGTELNSCESNDENCTYYADGNGSYTSSCEPIEPPPEECESDSLHEEGVDGWTYDGCEWQQTECNGDPSTEVPDSDSTGEEQGVGAGEAQLYDNDGNLVQYESYDPSTGEASFGAGNNPYQNGDWLRNSYGNIIYASRHPRMTIPPVSIAPNYSNNLSCVDGGVRTPSGKQSISIQVGWIYTGRKRWRSDFNAFQNETVFANSANQPVSDSLPNLAIIPAGTWVGIIPQHGAGPHTFYAFNGSANMPNGATGQKAYSDGVGGAYYGT